MEDFETTTPPLADERSWMSLDEACGRLKVTPRRLGEMVHQGLVTRECAGRSALYQLASPAEGSEAEGDTYVAALVNQLFEMEEENSVLDARLQAAQMQIEILLMERDQIVKERDEAVSRWKAARRELRLLIGSARGVIADTRQRVSAALHQVSSTHSVKAVETRAA